MPSYIADDKEEHFAQLSGTFSTDEANKVTTFGADGQANTGYTLPSASSWLLVEVFNVEGTAGDVGYHKWTNKVNQIASDLVKYRSIATAEYTTYDITVTHYKGNNTADVYRGDESTALSLASIDTGIAWTPPTTWIISDVIVAPDGFVYASIETLINPYYDGSHLARFTFNDEPTNLVTGEDAIIYGTGGSYVDSQGLTRAYQITTPALTDYIDTGITLPSGAWSISCFVELDANTTHGTAQADGNAIFGSGADTTGIYSLFFVDSENSLIDIQIGTSTTTRIRATYPIGNVADGQRHHLIVTHDGTTDTGSFTLIVDGNYVTATTDTETGTFNGTTQTESIRIGQLWRSNTSYYATFKGTIDQFDVFNKVLTLEEARWIGTTYPTEYNLHAPTITTATAGTGNTATDDDISKGTFHVETATGQVYLPYLRFVNTDAVLGKKYDAEVTITITSGTAEFRYLEAQPFDLPWRDSDQDQILTTGTYKFYGIVSYDYNFAVEPRMSVLFDGNTTYTSWDGTAEILLTEHMEQPYLIELNIDNTKVSGAVDLVDFPVFLTEANFADTLDFFKHIRSDGGDIRFYADEECYKPIAFEIASIDKDKELIEIYVKIPTVYYNLDTKFYMRYGNPLVQPLAVDAPFGRNAVWSDFDRVFHFADDPSLGTLTDSSGNQDGVAAGTWASNDLVKANGKSAWEWDGSTDQYVNLGTDAQFVWDETVDKYITLHGTLSTTGVRHAIVGQYNGTDSVNGAEFYCWWYSNNFYSMIGNNTSNATTSYPASGTYEIVYNLRSNGTNRYTSTTTTDTATQTVPSTGTNTQDVLMGASWTDNTSTARERWWDGTMGEFRLSLTKSFTDAWYETERENLLNPSTFTTATQITDISRWNYITNPSFGVNSDWTLGTNWSISVVTGRLYSSGSNTNAEAVIGIDSNTNGNALAVGDLVDIYVDVDTISGTLMIATHDNTGGDTIMLHSNTTTVGLHHKRHFIQATDEEFSLYSNTYTGYIKETGVFKVDGYLLGDEECDNGTFDANITGWTNQGSGSIQWDSGNQRLQVNGTTAYDGARYTKNLKNYTWYRVQFRIVDGTYTGQYYVKLDSGEGILNIDGKDAIRTVALKTGSTASTNGFLDIQQRTTSTGTWFIDDVSIEEIIEPNEALQEIYVNFISNSLDGTSDVVMNTLGYLDFRPTALVDRYGNPTDVKISLTTTQTLWYDATWGYNEGSDGYALPDEMMLSTAYDTQCPIDGRWAYTITGLDNRKTYSIEVMPSRSGTFTYPNTVYRISGHADQTVNIDNNMMDTAVFTGVSPIAGQVQLELAPDVDDGSIAINGIIIREEIATIIDTEMHSDPEFRSTSGWSGTGSGFTPNGNGTLSVAASPTVSAYRAIGGAPYTLYKISVTCGAVTTAGRVNVGVGGYNSSWMYFETEDTTRDLYFVASHPSANTNFYFGYYQTTFVGDLTHLSIKPVTKGLKLGPNIVRNPNFNDTSAWSLPTGVSITGGVLSVTSTATGISVGELTDDVEAGATYKVTVVVSAYTAGDYNVRLGEIGFVYGTDLSSQTTKVRTHEYYYYATYKNTNTVEIHHTETPTYSIESISVQKVLGEVNLAVTETSYGLELNDDLSFDTPASWTLGSDTSIASSLFDVGTSSTQSYNTISVGEKIPYRLILDVDRVDTAGYMTLGIGGWQFVEVYIDSVGLYTVDALATHPSSSARVYLGGGNFDGALESLSVKERLRNEFLDDNNLVNPSFDFSSGWTLGTGWTIDPDTGTLSVNTSGGGYATGEVIVDAGLNEIWKIQVSVSAYTSGNYKIRMGDGTMYNCYLDQETTKVGTHTYYVCSSDITPATFQIQADGTAVYSITHISAQKVLDAPPTPKSGAVYGDEVVVTADRTFATSTGWTLNGSATISGGVLDIPVGTSHSAQTTVGEAGLIDDSTYRVWYNVSNVVTAGVMRIGLGGYHNATVRVSAVGWQYVDIRVDDNRNTGKVVIAGNTADIQITEISIKRLISGEQLSAQILNDPDFDSGTTNWTFGTGWTSNTGYAAASSATGNLTNDVDFGDEYGTIYKVVIKLSSYTTGRLYADIGSGWAVYFQASNWDNPLDEHVCYVKRAALVNNDFHLAGVDSATLNVDYVKVYKVLS